MDDQQLAALNGFRETFLGFDIDAIDAEADNMLAAGVTIRQFLDTCTPAMAEIGEKFEKGEYYLPQLIMAGEMFKTASQKIKQALAHEDAGEAITQIVLGTPKSIADK